ncbi:hypothetical protein HDA32_005709 [Spinactinospora alkalitolerans]|uniref:Aminoacyl-transfer RNA synthetases class-II family profile domain-containing protein n=1 Tax=Spinactinospora alkalitolerans TaxID=687207 RepID=A0A852U312_9ACTN|nr:hypothetical protein [Spinactinospora alkalitolerans]NYE50589.1 hypothetical protein [Spinactinospora alkalitolerans]
MNKVSDGLAILDSDHTELLDTLDSVFTEWALKAGAKKISPPPVYRVAQLEKFDVYDNFPHLALVAGPLRPADESRPDAHRFHPGKLADAHLGLPTATCFGAYLFFEGMRVPSSALVTLANHCFRNEEYFDGLRRLLSFRMREIVALGTYEHTRNVIEDFKARIEAFLGELDLDFTSEAATDPFFDREGGRALLQRLQEVKREFTVDGLAIASVNTHRNFFGERCGITVENGSSHAFTSCVAFGLERWVSVLVDRYGTAAKAAEVARSAALNTGSD